MSTAVKPRKMIFTGANLNGCVTNPGATSKMRVGVLYVLCVLLPLVGVLWILHAGARLAPPVTAAVARTSNSFPASSIVLRPAIFLVQIIVIIAASRILGAVLRKLGQPRVIGEMLAGLILGPSLLGLLAPNVYEWLFPFGTVRFLSALAQTGLVLFMFIVGMELDVNELRGRHRETFVVSQASIMVPMLAGTALALALYRKFAVVGTEFTTFALFLGCAMSITALPVLARILRESNLGRSTFGSTALGCAAIADVSAWIIFAITISIARDDSTNTQTPLWRSIAALAVYLFVMVAVVRPVLHKICARWRDQKSNEQSLSPDQLGAVLLIMLASAAATELLKIHAIFGAFVAGVMMPRNKSVSESVSSRLDDLLSILLLPLFFAYAGLRTNVGALNSLQDWMVCGMIIAVAVISKIGSCVIAGRSTGMPLRTATGLGVLMNARGLMELVLLTIGLQLGIITPQLFTIMFIMAIFTTAITSPLFHRVMQKRQEQPAAQSELASNRASYPAVASLSV